ncbi:FecR family protein [Variovorax sp. LT1R16]|uniref:FecR family protein n=1 Tax=Variovorax sp. LT1R16 TaxID=3443728 RepID=UPI003F4832FE
MTLSRPLPTPPPSDAIARQARAWMDRVAAGRMTPADGDALRRWCRADPAHQAALAEARRGWSLLGAAGALSAARAPQRTVVRSPSRRWFIGGGLGFATAAAAAAIVHPPLGLWPSMDELQADHRTGIGERRSVALGGGVRVELNTRTSIALRPDGIALIAGEAAVDLQGPGSRITVEADKGRVSADGARFELRGGPEGICVSCLAGRVEVAHAAGVRNLEAGQQLVYDARGLGPARVVDAGALSRLSAWREGYLRFVDTPLGEVVAEINRYRAGQVVLLDRQLAGKQVTGRFQIASLDRAIAQIQHSLGLGVRSLPGGLVLLS